MSENEAEADKNGAETVGESGLRRTTAAEAKTRKSWGFAWIWSIPIAALGIVGWLLFRHVAEGGTGITITFANICNIDPKNTDVRYRGMSIGSVSGVSLAKDGNGVEVSAKIQDGAARFLRSGTVFWLKGANPSLSDLSTIGSILSGPKLVMRPGPGSPTTHFSGLGREPLPADCGTPVSCGVSFNGSVGSLSEGDHVKIRGFTVGEVKEVGFHYDAQTGAIATPLIISLYPGLFRVVDAPESSGTTALLAALGRLVDEGLRARLEREPALIGSFRVTLAMVPGAPAAHLDLSQNPPEIPTAPGGGLKSIISQVQDLPLEQIADNLLDITKHVDQIVASPNLEDSVKQLHGSLVEIHGVVNNVGPKVDQLVQSLRATAGQLDQAAGSVSTAVGGPASQTGLNDTLQELKEAARAVRSLADYLERHPESLLTGKPGR